MHDVELPTVYADSPDSDEKQDDIYTKRKDFKDSNFALKSHGWLLLGCAFIAETIAHTSAIVSITASPLRNGSSRSSIPSPGVSGAVT